MQTFDYVTFLQYNNWANGRLLDIAERLPDAQLRTGALTRGSGYATLRHMLDAEWSWRVTCENPANREEPPWTLESLNELPALRAYWQAEAERLMKLVQGFSDADLEREVVPVWIGKPVKLRHTLVHVVNHATNHRSEIAAFFTGLGHSPGDLEYVDYVMGLVE